jgi:ribokinase
MIKLVVVGSLNIDLTMRVKSLPLQGETALANDFKITPGGKGANQALASARFGASVKMAGRVGQDQYGKRLLSSMKAGGVDVSHVIQDENVATGMALITVDNTGANTITVYPGANNCYAYEDVDALESVIADADAIIAQLEIPMRTVERAFAIARQHHVTTVLNPSPVNSLSRDFLAKTDIIIPNEVEASSLCGCSVKSVDTAIQAAKQLVKMGSGMAIVTLGENGAVSADQKGVFHVPAFPVSSVDSTGAGDAFVAAFTVALSEGVSVFDALRYGCAAGAIATTKIGAQSAVPTRKEVEQMVRDCNK